MKVKTWGLYLISALLAVAIASADHRFQVGPLVLYPPEIIIYPLFFAACLYTPARRRLIESWASLDKSVRWAIYLIVAGALVSTIFSSVHVQSLGALKAWVISPLILFWLIWAFVKQEKVIMTTVAFLAIALLLRGAADIFHHGWGIRLNGYYESPNYFSALAAPIVVVLFGFGRKKNAWVLIVLGLLLLAEVALTRSFGGLLGIVIALLLAFYYLGKRTRLLLISTIVVLALLLGPTAFKRFGSSGNSFDSRVQIWNVSARMISDEPITGVGLRAFEARFPDYIVGITTTPYQWDAAQPHNLFLAVWLGLGLLGLVGFVVLLWQILRWRSSPTAFHLALIAILAHGLVDTPYFRVDLVMIFWVYVAAILITKKTFEAEI